MKKLLLVNNCYPSDRFPNKATYIKTIQFCLEQAGFDVRLLVIRYNSKSVLMKIVYYIIFFILLSVKSLSCYDIIYINNPTFALPIFFRKSLYLKKIFLHWHGNELVSNGWYIRFALRIMKSKMNKVRHIVPSLYLKMKLIEILTIITDDIIVSPSGGVDQDLFAPQRNNKKNNECLVIGFASAMQMSKGMDIVLELVRRKDELQNILKKIFGLM